MILRRFGYTVLFCLLIFVDQSAGAIASFHTAAGTLVFRCLMQADSSEEDSTVVETPDTTQGRPEGGRAPLIGTGMRSKPPFRVDSTEVEETVDSSETEPSKPWRVSIKAQCSSLNERKGVDLGGNAPTLELSARVMHDIGAYVSFCGTERLSSPLFYQQSTLSAGYSYDYSDNISLSADASVYGYPNDSVNALAGSPASLSLALDVAGKGLDYGFSLDHYFGNPVANYLTAAVSHDFSIGEEEALSLTPCLSLTYGSTKYKLKKLNTEKTVRGLSAATIDLYASYRLGGGFTLSADPTLVVSFQKDLLKVFKGNLNATSKVTQFLIVASLRYSYSF